MQIRSKIQLASKRRALGGSPTKSNNQPVVGDDQKTLVIDIEWALLTTEIPFVSKSRAYRVLLEVGF